jgi:glutathione synthase/RimK-type ligase-like ATP-grasp enzyme
VEHFLPEDEVHDLLSFAQQLANVDLCVLKSHTELALSLAALVHRRGTPVLNPYPACAATMNKIVATWLLRRAGVPVPETWLTGSPQHALNLLQRGPLVAKPSRGHRGQGVRFCHQPSDFDGLDWNGQPILVQELIPGNGEDLKVYVAGRHVAAIRKRFAPGSFAMPGAPVPVTPQVERIAHTCGAVLGLQLYGVDVIEAPDGPRVVDVNYFPGYKGVADSPQWLAECILEEARRL